jgi:hypothetical protein
MKEDEMGGSCRTREKDEKCFSWEPSKEDTNWKT